MKDEKNIIDDYEYSRSTYYELIDKGRESLDVLMEVARETEHPRAFEVLSGMIKNMADINDKLMDLNKKTRDLNKEEVKAIENKTTNNLFVGSTTDLQRLLQQGVTVDAEPESKD